ncbi:MAG: AAA family ATPase, partial [Ruminobacter sp.]|nr:AAA family ATPase [Ruminobacter sp.]
MDKIKRIAQGKSFKNFIARNRIYVDKTKEIFSLLSEDRVFLARPRRFGKSTILDTIGTLFEFGVDPYFKGTWIYDEWEENTYPVLRLSFIDFSVTNLANFERDFIDRIDTFAREIKLDNFVPANTAKLSLQHLFDAFRFHKNFSSFVILIDEYDTQLTANINNPELYEEFKILLREIYGALKDKDEIRFLGITGVTRLKDVTIFSVGSDILDVTYDNDVATITGFTREEIAKYYIDYLNLGVSLEKNKKVEE